jgi:glycosyltransferase involved in cell wall biosynthesis
MIVGSSSDDELTTRITHAAISDPTIEARIQFIPDSEVATYFGAADAVCLPFQRITTSSSALLALSFGKPLIAPRIGALKDLPLDTGFLYGDDTDRTLPGALQLFFDASDEELWTRGANGLAYAKSLSWAGIAERTYDLYSNILA